MPTNSNEKDIDMHAKSHDLVSLDLKEAATFLGFRGTYHLREKAKMGKIPGAFKISNRWMFLKDELIAFARSFHKRLNDASEIIPKSSDSWQLAKRQAAHIITPASQSAESECKNLLDALQNERRKNMKRSAERT